MNIVFFFLDAIVFLAIVVTVVSLATAAAVLFSGITAGFSLRSILPVLAFVISLIIGSILAYHVVRASIPSGRWLNLLLMTLIAPVMIPIIWSAMKYTRRNLRED